MIFSVSLFVWKSIKNTKKNGIQNFKWQEKYWLLLWLYFEKLRTQLSSTTGTSALQTPLNDSCACFREEQPGGMEGQRKKGRYRGKMKGREGQKKEWWLPLKLSLLVCLSFIPSSICLFWLSLCESESQEQNIKQSSRDTWDVQSVPAHRLGERKQGWSYSTALLVESAELQKI